MMLLFIGFFTTVLFLQHHQVDANNKSCYVGYGSEFAKVKACGDPNYNMCMSFQCGDNMAEEKYYLCDTDLGVEHHKSTCKIAAEAVKCPMENVLYWTCNHEDNCNQPGFEGGPDSNVWKCSEDPQNPTTTTTTKKMSPTTTTKKTPTTKKTTTSSIKPPASDVPTTDGAIGTHGGGGGGANSFAMACVLLAVAMFNFFFFPVFGNN